MIEDFKALVANRNKHAQEERDKGKQIIGWTCTYVPEEIIYAAGLFPWRLLGGNGEITVADAYLYSSCCSFVRSCFDEGFKGELDFLDGYVTGNTCDFIRRLFDVWKQYLVEKTPFLKMLSIPFKKTETAMDFYKKELVRFMEDLEGFFEVKVTEDSLKNAIALYNETRVLLGRLYNLRKEDKVPISGADTMDVVLSAMVTDRKIYNQRLKELLMELEDAEAVNPRGARIMVLGSELADSEYIRIIEDLGGLVVCDDLCTGRRYFSSHVDEDKDPIEALADRYLKNAFCPRMFPYEERVRVLSEIIEDFHIEGVIYETIKFCEAHGVRYPLYKQKFSDLGVPVLKLEREHGLSGIGQTKTRVQAFFESIGE